MRALVLTTSYPLREDSLSGRFIERLLDGLGAQGWAFHVLTPAPAGGPLRATRGAVTLEALDFPGRSAGLVHAGGIPERLAASPWRLAAVPGMCDALARAARRHAGSGRFDLVWSHWLLPSGWLGAGVAAGAGLPHVATAHGADVHLAERLARVPGMRARLAARFARTRLTAPAALTAARVGAALGGCDVATAPLPADPAPGGRREARHAGPLRVLFLGRFEPIKGATLLVEAVRRLGDAPIEVVLAGAGGEERALRAAARHVRARVTFPGVLSGAALMTALGEADLLVVPSLRMRSGRTEGLPHAATSALAAGLPVLSSDGGALAGLLRAHGAGDVFDASGGPAAAARSLAAALGRFAADRERLARLAGGARAAGRAYHPERALSAWDRLLSAALVPEPGGAARPALAFGRAR